MRDARLAEKRMLWSLCKDVAITPNMPATHLSREDPIQHQTKTPPINRVIALPAKDQLGSVVLNLLQCRDTVVVRGQRSIVAQARRILEI